jgi:hypothetical protein
VAIDRRQELLHFLRATAGAVEDAEQFFAFLLSRYGAGNDFVVGLKSALAETYSQSVILERCMRRIEGVATALTSCEPAFVPARRVPISWPVTQMQYDLEHLCSMILRGAQLCEAAIVAAESSGMFETRFACETVLAQMASTMNLLSECAVPLDLR